MVLNINLEIIITILIAILTVAWMIFKLITTPLEQRVTKLENKLSKRDDQLFMAITTIKNDIHALTVNIEKRFSTVVTEDECKQIQQCNKGTITNVNI